MKIKKLSAIFLSVIMVAAFALPINTVSVSAATPKATTTPPPGDGTGDGTGGGTGDEVPETPLSVSQPYVFSMESQVFKAGDIIPISIVLGVTDGYVGEARMKLTGPADMEEMFSFYTSTGWLNIGDISEKMKATPFVRINPSVPDGTHAVTVTFEFTLNGKITTSTSKLNFVVKGKSNQAPFVSSAAFKSAEIGKENKSDLVVKIDNPSSGDFNDVSVSFNPEGSKGFSLYKTTRDIQIGVVPAQQSSSATFPIYVDTAVVTGNYPISFNLSYKDGSGAIITSVEQIYVQVNRSADATGKGSVPRIIISSYTTDTEIINAGQTFTLEFTLKNTSSTTAVSNIKAVLGAAVTSGTGSGANASGGEVFFPAQGSNSFYIEKIPTGGEVKNSIKLMARKDVEPGVYPIYIDLNFENETGEALTSKEQISFSVTQEQRLDIQGMTIPTDAMMGSPIPVTFQYINKGKSTIQNLSITVDGDFTLEGGSQYIGNLTAGYNDYFDNVLMPSKEGELKGDIVLKFEGSDGEEKETRIPITCNVSAGMTGDMPGMGGGIEPMPMPEPQGGGLLSTILWIGIPVIVVIAIVLALIIILKKRKAKKEMVEDEED